MKPRVSRLSCTRPKSRFAPDGSALTFASMSRPVEAKEWQTRRSRINSRLDAGGWPLTAGATTPGVGPHRIEEWDTDEGTSWCPGCALPTRKARPRSWDNSHRTIPKRIASVRSESESSGSAFPDPRSLDVSGGGDRRRAARCEPDVDRRRRPRQGGAGGQHLVGRQRTRLATNAMLVERIRRFAELAERPIATPSLVRERLGLAEPASAVHESA